jgi:hypothetical protein
MVSPEALNQIINVHIPLAQTLWPQTPDGRSSTVGWTVLQGFFTLEMFEPVRETVTQHKEASFCLVDMC